MILSGDLARLAIVAEVTPGTTPSNPVFSVVPYTGDSLTYQPQTVRSRTISGHRQTVDSALVGAGVSGSINAELAYEDVLQVLMEAALGGTWSTNVLKVGTMARSFTVERKLEAGVTDQFQRYLGCVVGGFALRLSTDNPATIDFDLMGRDISTGTAILSGATYVDPAGNPSIVGPNVASIAIGGVEKLPGTVIGDASITVANNLRGIRGLGMLGYADIVLGAFDVTASWQVYFQDGADITLLKAQTATDIVFTVTDSLGKDYIFDLPKIKLTDVKVDAGGKNTDVIATISAEGIYNVADLSSMIITRSPT